MPQVLWYKDTMKLIEGERMHMSSVENTAKCPARTMVTTNVAQYSNRSLDRSGGEPILAASFSTIVLVQYFTTKYDLFQAPLLYL